MDNYREKIVRIVERELKRTEEYLNYCKKHGITRNYLVKKEEYDGIDAMKFYDKSAVAKFEKNRKTQDLCR